MTFLTRFTNGWHVAMASLKVLGENKRLIVFPLMSGSVLAMIIVSFFTFILYPSELHSASRTEPNNSAVWLFLFLFYIVNYFIVVYFNMALMHCARQYFEGEEVSVANGLKFSASRIGTIFIWAVFAATVGTLLKAMQDNFGWLGKLVIGFVGFAWSVGTFFVIPVIAYEEVGPFDAVKRSANIMKQKWGESLGANFSIGLVCMLAILPIGIAGMGVSAYVSETAGIYIFAAGFLLIIALSSALHSIFVSALYNSIHGHPTKHFSQQMINDVFE
jgi:hypothetical protein